ncbi:MAG: hypothetical protein AAFR52_08990 [Pseudomonadota bacterium]
MTASDTTIDGASGDAKAATPRERAAAALGLARTAVQTARSAAGQVMGRRRPAPTDDAGAAGAAGEAPMGGSGGSVAGMARRLRTRIASTSAADVRQRFGKAVRSTTMFRSVAVLLVLAAIAQWGLIFFNYWR